MKKSFPSSTFKPASLLSVATGNRRSVIPFSAKSAKQLAPELSDTQLVELSSASPELKDTSAGPTSISSRAGPGTVQTITSPRVGFAGVQLAPGASSSVTFVVTKRWISAWMEEKEEWEVVRGMFTMSVGSASDDIRQEKMFLVN